ncbi:MAG: hypothetical protein JWN11_1279 [Hyphomicrobiales bacterium]|nr:hypothetical protein [Hyphomicrobiales bacterium]
MSRQLALTAAALLFLGSQAEAAGWSYKVESSPLLPKGEHMYSLSTAGGTASFTCDSMQHRLSFGVQLENAIVTRMYDGYRQTVILGRQDPVGVRWSVDGGVGGTGKWAKAGGFAFADAGVTQQIFRALRTGKVLTITAGKQALAFGLSGAGKGTGTLARVCR